MHKQTRSVRGPGALLAVGTALVALALLGAPPAFGQIIDAGGYVTSVNWLALGPFSNPFGCSGRDADILCNHIAPSFIYCQYPEEGDEIDYNPAQACTTGYTGPLGTNGKPVWTLFDDGSDNCHNDLDGDAADTLDDVVKFLATYFEYAGTSPITVQICGNSDDGLQVWLDDKLVINDNACRGAGACASNACDDLVAVTVTPGLHRIIAAAWDRGGGWAVSVGLRVDGVPVVDGGDFVFYGTENPGLNPPCAEVNIPRRAVTDLADANACPPGARGPIKVAVTEPGGTPTETVTVIETISGAIGAAGVTADNGGTVTEARMGFIQQWLLLGPYVNTGGADPNADPLPPQVQDDFLTDGDTTESDVQPKDGDTIASTAPLAVTPNDATINPGGVPTWNVWNDTDDTIDFNGYYGGDVDNIMMYAVCYVNFAAAGSNLYMGVGSDDSIQVLFDGESVWARSIPRGWGNAMQAQDVFPLPSPISAGVHRVMVKVFEGGGGHGFRLRFQDAGGNPVTAGITVSLDPSGSPTTPFPEQGGGATITWNVQRSVLQGAGVSYTANVNLGTFNFAGTVAGKATQGTRATTLAAPGNDLGPFDMAGGPEDDLTHGNEIGVACAGATITQPNLGSIAITAGGADIWGTADQFVYAYSAQTGDFTVTVDVIDHVMGNNEWAKHGIMVRENCSPGSRYFYVCDQHTESVFTNDTCYQWRDAQSVDANWPGSSVLPDGTHSGTFKVERIGSMFVGYAYNLNERDGTELVAGGPEWIELGRRDWNATGLPAPAAVQVGLAVTSHDGCNLVTVTFENYDVSLGTPPQPPVNAVCSGNAQGGVDVTWTLVGRAAGNQKISLNGAEIATIAGTDTSYTVTADKLVDGVNRVCVSNDLGSTCCGYYKGTELYINCGGQRLDPNDPVNPIDIGDGRVWEEDTLANPSPFLASANLNTADFAAGLETPIQWAPCDTQLVEPDFTDDPTRSWLFSTERWADADVKYRIPLPLGSYDVTLLFAEGCCSDGCQDIPDPQLSGGGCRVFDIVVNGNVVADQFSQHVEAQKGVGNVLPNANWGVALAKGPYTVLNTGVIEITIDDLGGGSPPENASIKGIAIKPFTGVVENCTNQVDDDGDQKTDCADEDCASAPECQKKQFHRGDPNNDGAINITDGIYILNFLFLGGPKPTCLESANPNDDASVNITDGIYVLNFLFLGGPPPTAPGPVSSPCGPDPAGSPSDLGCETYTKC